MQQNKITTKQTLQKLQQNLQDKQFRKEFGRLFVDYLDINNRDNNAFYHKILKLLQDRGFSKQEAEDFFKDLRVKNKDSIIKISKIQQDINKLQENYKKNRIKILINPLSVATLISLYYNLYEEITKNIAKLKEEMLLKLKTNVHLDKKIREIEEILNKNLKELQELQQQKENDKIAKLNDIFNTTTKLEEKLEDLQETLVLQELDNTISGKEEKQKKEIQTQHQDQQQPDQQNNPSSPNQVDKDILEELRDFVNKQQTTLTAELEDCLKSIATNTNTADPKTLAFLTISEYVHRGNEIEDKELFKHFNEILNQKEFNAIININKALINGALEYSTVKNVLEKGIDGIMELGENISIKQQKDKLNKEKEKEIGIGQPSKLNLSMPSLN